jgi:ATP-dependent helicase/nuclease subunit A
MSVRENIPEAISRAQIAASDPNVSAWVAANAGSGKTFVLAQRVIRLLLSGVEPSRILCITFTKAAAANMANQVFSRLAEWTALDDGALDEAMKRIGVRNIDAALRARARQLFALALETPGGLKVQTVHAFCTRLLHLFPFEAKVAARFSVLEEAAERQLLDRVCLEVLLDAAVRPASALGRALAATVAVAADATVRDLLGEAIAERDKFSAWIEAAGGLQGAIAQLSNILGVAPGDSPELIEAEIVNGPHLPMSKWTSVAAMLVEGSANDQKQGAYFTEAITARGTEQIDAYFAVFFTDNSKGPPRKALITAPLAKKHPDLARRLSAEQQRAELLRSRQRAIAVRDRTAALLTLAAEAIERYGNEKARRGLLDYDDLIDKALGMLSTTAAGWVHYKLDRGIDHVLIDEAQDTSPKQWAVIEKLVAEFTAGAGAGDFVKRTIFAVGDEKQSIFSFQGAAPLKFAEMRRHFERAHRESGVGFVYSQFGHSFRSGVNVLGAVNDVFRAREIFVSVTTDEAGIPPHEALPDAAPGLVELWTPLKPDEEREVEAWERPFDALVPTSPQVKLARKIAKTIGHWQRQGTRPGEVLILVRRRGSMFEAVIRALKDAGIAVAGADRLVLTEHIAVMDLIALADALLLPDDDLALASVLKSPLFDLDEDQLFQIAWNRKGTLHAALLAKAADDPKFGEAAARLDQFAQAARRETPFGFYAWLLNARGGRARMLARLGPEAADALDEFLNLALDYERGQTPSLQGFVAWLRAARVSIKRDMEIARDEVRVMTVHGAKGLEARNVILTDTTTPPKGWHPPRLLALPAKLGAPPVVVWAGSKDRDVGPMSEARAAAQSANEDEYRRLLYVAMTRAAERLIVCGTEGEKRRPENCWYDLVQTALKPGLVEEPADDGDGTVWRYRKALVEQAAQTKTPDAEPKPIMLPPWLMRDVPSELPKSIVITPSRAYEEAFTSPRARGEVGARSAPGEGASQRSEHFDTPPHPDPLPAGGERGSALLRGNLVHRLMQSLPDIAPELRLDAARRFLARAGRDLSSPDHDEILRQVQAVLGDPAFAALFAPGSRAEITIAGRHKELSIAGQVDRIAITADGVFIADYKTNRPAPRTLDEAQKRYPSYVTQLALYRAVLARLYPARPVRAALVWTETPQLMEIPAAALDLAAARIFT